MARRGPPQTPKNTIEQNRKISDRQTIAVTDLLSLKIFILLRAV